MNDSYNDLTDQLNNELTKAYLGGLLDGTGSVTIKIHKASDYAFGFNIEPEITISKSRPHSIQIVDDWAAANGIYGSANKYEDRYQFRMNRTRDITRFLMELLPYIKDRQQEVELMIDDILPLFQESHHLESKENFIEVVELIDELKTHSVRARGESKYTAEFFRERWADELEA